MAKKVLAQSDLDLVLTEYYKDRLESQLKNRETSINDDNLTKSTASIIETHLPVPIDWVPLAKPSSTRPFFPLFIPPSSLLSLSSLSTQAIPSISYYHNHTCLNTPLSVAGPTFSKSSLSLSPFLNTNTKEVNQEVMAANTPNTKDTPTQPLFQAPFITPMLYPGAPDSPFFERANISEFLERFENMCDDYQMSTPEKIRRLP